MSAISNYNVPQYTTNEEDQVFDQFYNSYDMAASAAGSTHVEPWIVEAVNREFDLLASDGVSDASLWTTPAGPPNTFPAVDFSPESIGTELPSPFGSPLFDDQAGTFDSFDAGNQALFPQTVPAASVNDDPAALFSQVDAAFKDLARARAAADPRPISRKKKQRDASIALYLERLRDTCNQAVAMLDSEAQDDEDLETPFQSFAQPMAWQNSTTASDSSFIDSNSFSTISSPQSSPIGVGPSSRASPAARTSPVTGGVEMVMDLNMNEATSLPRKHRPRTQAQRERYIAVRNQGACEKHKRQHKRCTCVDQQFTVTTNVTQQQPRHTITKAGPHTHTRTQPQAAVTSHSQSSVSPDLLAANLLPPVVRQAHAPERRYSGVSSNYAWSQSTTHSSSGEDTRRLQARGQTQQSLSQTKTTSDHPRETIYTVKRPRDGTVATSASGTCSFSSTRQGVKSSSYDDDTCPRSRALRESRNKKAMRSHLQQQHLSTIQRDYMREDPGTTQCRSSTEFSDLRTKRDPRANASGLCSCAAPPHEPAYRVPSDSNRRIITRESASGGDMNRPRPDRRSRDSCRMSKNSREELSSSASSVATRDRTPSSGRGWSMASNLLSPTKLRHAPTRDTKSTHIAFSGTMPTSDMVRHVVSAMSRYSRTLRWFASNAVAAHRKSLQSNSTQMCSTNASLQGNFLMWCLVWALLLLVSSITGFREGIIAGSSKAMR